MLTSNQFIEMSRDIIKKDTKGKLEGVAEVINWIKHRDDSELEKLGILGTVKDFIITIKSLYQYIGVSDNLSNCQFQVAITNNKKEPISWYIVTENLLSNEQTDKISFELGLLPILIKNTVYNLYSKGDKHGNRKTKF